MARGERQQCVKALFLANDDGVSAEMWRVLASNYLQRGRPVLAITDDRNTHDAVGIGDGLPSYGDVLTAHADFTNRKVSRADAQALVDELRRLPGSTVVLWNMSVFEWCDLQADWLDVFQQCVRMRQDVVFMHFAGSQWYHGGSDAADELISQVAWDYACGSRVVTDFNHAYVRGLLPTLASAIDKLSVGKGPGRQSQWQTLSPRCSLHHVGPHWELPQRQELLLNLPCCRGGDV